MGGSWHFGIKMLLILFGMGFCLHKINRKQKINNKNMVMKNICVKDGDEDKTRPD